MGLVNIPLDFCSGLGNEFFNRLTEMNGLRKRNSNPEKHKLLFVLGPLFKLFEAVLELFNPILVAQIIDKGVTTGDVSIIWKITNCFNVNVFPHKLKMDINEVFEFP